MVSPNVSLRVISRIDVVMLREVVDDHPDFTPAVAILGDGVDDMAAVMESDVAAWIWPDNSQIVFRRSYGDTFEADNAEFEAKGWRSCGCQAVRSYGSLLEYQASPG